MNISEFFLFRHVVSITILFWDNFYFLLATLSLPLSVSLCLSLSLCLPLSHIPLFTYSSRCWRVKTGKTYIKIYLIYLTLSGVMLKNDQTYFKNLAVFTPLDFWSCTFGHFSKMCLKVFIHSMILCFFLHPVLKLHG